MNSILRNPGPVSFALTSLALGAVVFVTLFASGASVKVAPAEPQGGLTVSG